MFKKLYNVFSIHKNGTHVMENNEPTLEIIINNKKPITLIDLTNSLSSFNNQYLRFLDDHEIPYDETKKTLFVKELKSGSAIIELGTTICYALPLFEQFNTLYEFSKNIRAISEYLLGMNNEKPNLTKKDIVEISNFYDATASDPGSSIIVQVKGDHNDVQIHYTGVESAAIQNGARKELDKLNDMKNSVLKKQLLVFFQARFNDLNAGTKAVIENVTTKPLKVIFENKDMQNAMMSNHEGFSKPWQKLAYIVDVEVQTIEGFPKVYKIINYYENEIIDPEEI